MPALVRGQLVALAHLSLGGRGWGVGHRTLPQAPEDVLDLVFSRENGSPIWPRTFSRAFDRHVKDVGLQTIRLHDLRHTNATLALRAGVHPKVVSERLGHSGVGITLDSYSHAIPAMQEDAAAKVGALLDG